MWQREGQRQSCSESTTLRPDSYTLLNTDPQGLVPQLRGIASETYSAASKGVHHEFVLSMAAYYDDATLEKLTEDSLWLVATMAVVANFDESTAFALTPSRSVKCYEESQ